MAYSFTIPNSSTRINLNRIVDHARFVLSNSKFMDIPLYVKVVSPHFLLFRLTCLCCRTNPRFMYHVANDNVLFFIFLIYEMIDVHICRSCFFFVILHINLVL